MFVRFFFRSRFRNIAPALDDWSAPTSPLLSALLPTTTEVWEAGPPAWTTPTPTLTTTTTTPSFGHAPTWSPEWQLKRAELGSAGRSPLAALSDGAGPLPALTEEDVPDWAWATIGLLGGVALLVVARCLLWSCCG